MMQTKKSGNRTRVLEMVRNLGDYNHNCEVRRRGEGEIVLWRSPPEPVAAEKYALIAFLSSSRNILGGGVAVCSCTFVGASCGHLHDSTAFLFRQRRDTF